MMKKLAITALACLLPLFAGAQNIPSTYWFGYWNSDCTGSVITIYEEWQLEYFLEAGIILSYRPVVWGRPMQCFTEMFESEVTR